MAIENVKRGKYILELKPGYSLYKQINAPQFGAFGAKDMNGLNFSLGWSDELARILFIWISLLGATVCVKRGQHFSFSVLAAWLGKRSNHILHAVATLLVIGFCLFFTWYGYKSFLLSFRQNFIVLEIPWAWAFAAVPISGALMGVYSFPLLIHHLKALAQTPKA